MKGQSEMSEIHQMDLTICKLDVSTNNTCRYYFEIFCSTQFKETEGWGFEGVEFKNKVISATFMHKVHSYYYTWNETLQTKERSYVDIVKEIYFIMDFGRHLLMVRGKQQDMNAVKQGLRKAFWNHFVYDEVTMAPLDYLNVFISEKMLSGIKEVTIDNFEYLKQMVGRYVVKRINEECMEDFLKVNQQNIKNMKLSLSFQDSIFDVVVKSGGRLTCKSTGDVNHDFMFFIKNIAR